MPELPPSFFYEYRPATGKAILSEPVVLVPGWGFTHQCWGVFAERLNEFAHIILLDWPNLPEEASLEKQLASIFAEWQKHLPNNAVYLGWSLGGMVVERWASAFPNRVSRWIAVGANAQFVADDTWPTAMPKATYDGFAEQVAQSWESAGKYFIRLASRDHAADTLTAEQRKQHKMQQVALQKQLQLALMSDAEQAIRYLDVLAGFQKAPSFGISVKNSLPKHLKLFAKGDGLVPIEAAAALNNQGDDAILLDGSHVMHLTKTDGVINSVRSFLEEGQFFCPKARIAQSFSRAAPTYDSVAHLQRRVAANLMDRWKTVLSASDHMSDGGTYLDVGCGTGVLLPYIEQMFANSQTFALDLAEGMVRFARQKHQSEAVNHWLCGDGESLPLADESVDGIVSSLAVQWCSDLPRLLQEWWRVLRKGGSVAIATVGSQSLWQLREAWQTVDEHTHVNRFEPLNAWQTHWQEAKLDLLDQSTQVEQLCFKDLRQLSYELKALGAHNMNAGKPSGLTGRQRLLDLQKAYEHYRTQDGLPLDYEIHYFVAKKIGELK